MFSVSDNDPSDPARLDRVFLLLNFNRPDAFKFFFHFKRIVTLFLRERRLRLIGCFFMVIGNCISEGMSFFDSLLHFSSSATFASKRSCCRFLVRRLILKVIERLFNSLSFIFLLLF